MPVEAPELPAGAAVDVSPLAPERAAASRDSRNPRERTKPERSKASQEARAKVEAVAKEMAAKKLLLGDNSPNEPVAATDDDKPVAPKTTAPKADVQKEKQAEPTAEEKAATAEKSKRISAAKRALALDGFDPEDIEAMAEDKLLRLGAHRAKNQADVNREFDRLRKAATSPTGARNDDGTFAKTDGKAEAAPAPAPSKSDDQDSAKTPLATGDAEIDALIEGSKDDLGEPAVKLLKAISSKLLARVATAGTEASSSGMQMSREVLNMRILDRIREQHSEAIDEAPTRFDEVVENLRAYVGSGRFLQGELHKAIDAAIYTEFGPPDTVRKAQRDALARQHAANIGRVDSGRGDKGSSATSSSNAPVNGKDQLKLAAAMFARNPDANLDALHTELMGKLKGKGRAA